MNINHDQATALARYIHAVRDDWGIDGILTALGRVREQAPIETITLWAIKAAVEPSNRTPAIIAMPGAHREQPKPERRSHNVPCSDHPDETLPCRRCTAARVPADEPTAAALARAALTQTLARLCRHGIDRDRATCRECERPDQPTDQPEETE